ncbi:MAG: hypothetical protein Kow0075_16680 [Salibacteraceae bacterium]
MKSNKVIHVVVIDDDETDFFLLNESLSEIESFKVECQWVSDFEEAKKTLQDCKPDIFFIDYLLGGNNGLDLIKFGISVNCMAPMVMLTGYADPDLDRQALRAGATDYISKEHINPELLERIVRHSIERFDLKLRYHQQENKFRNLFEQSTDGIFIVDQNWSVIDINESLIRIYGIKPNEVKRPLVEIILPEDVRDDFLKTLKEQGNVQNFPITVGRNEVQMHLLISCKPVYDNFGHISGYQGMVRDVSELKEAEKRIARAEQFNLTARMARIIAHEIRNPLSNIMLAVDFMTENLDDSSPEKPYVDIIRRNTSRINDLIDSLLTSTKTTELNREQFAVADVISHAIEVCKDRINMKNVSLQWDTSGRNIELNGDFEKISIVLVNIITNAIEAMEESLKPTLVIQQRRENNKVYIHIKDNGKGMDEVTKSKLFDPFFTGRHGGIGLGLSAVHHLVSQHEGEIVVHSKPGKGSEFIVILPAE